MGELKQASYSALSTYTRCRRKYWLKYIMGYREPASDGQRRGTVMHAATAEWYRTRDEQKALDKLSAELAVFEKELDKTLDEDWDLCGTVLQRYMKQSAVEDSKLTFLHSELEFRMDIAGVPLVGFIDGVLRDHHGLIWLLENKFEKDVRDARHADLDLQVTIYMMAARKFGLNPYGVIYNMVRMREGGVAADAPWARSYVHRNQEGLDQAERELEGLINEMKLFWKGDLPVYPTPTRDCSWQCKFYTHCLARLDDGSGESVLNRMERKSQEEVLDEQRSDIGV